MRIDVETILRDRAVGPFHVGMTLVEIGQVAPAPDYWEFAPGDRANFYIGYRPLEIHLEESPDGIRVCFIKLKVFKFDRAIRIAGRDGFWDLSVGKRWRRFEQAEAELVRAGFEYTTGFEEVVNLDTWGVLNVRDSARLYFAEDKNDADRKFLWSIELS